MVGLLVVGACSSGGDSSDGLTRYCAKATAYKEATANVDTSSPESVIAGFAAAAVAARDVADVAPEGVRIAHERLATGAETLVAGLRQRAPKTMAELEAANAEVVAGLTADLGDLDDETSQTQDFAAKECGLDVR